MGILDRQTHVRLDRTSLMKYDTIHFSFCQGNSKKRLSNTILHRGTTLQSAFKFGFIEEIHAEQSSADTRYAPSKLGRYKIYCCHKCFYILYLVSCIFVSYRKTAIYRTLAKKVCSLSLLGLSKISSGVPSSMMRPSAMKMTRLPTSRAKPISWVTTIMVIPS